MIRSEFREALEKQQHILVLLWVFFLCAVFIYLWIAEFILRRSGFSAGTAVSETVRVALWLLALFDLGTFMWWRKRFLTNEAILGGAKKYKLLQALQGHSSPLEQRAAGVISAYVTSKIVGFAIIEAIAVYGLILTIVGGYSGDQYLFSFASCVLLLLEFPSKLRLEELLREVEA